MKTILFIIFCMVAVPLTLLQFHENSHQRVYENYGCETINRTLFEVSATGCPPENLETINFLITQQENQYANIFGISMIILLLIANILVQIEK